MFPLSSKRLVTKFNMWADAYNIIDFYFILNYGLSRDILMDWMLDIRGKAEMA